MGKKIDLQQRWINCQSDIDSLFKGESKKSPFGFTNDGLHDYRGMVLHKNLRPVGLSLSNIDFSYFEGKYLIFADSSIIDCQFENSKFELGDVNSQFKNVSFLQSKLKGSGFAGKQTCYTRCNFTKADLTGSTGNGGTFQECKFENTKLKNSVLGTCTFRNSKFSGKIENVLFGGQTGFSFSNCDFRGSSFINCAFNHLLCDSCLFSDKAILFPDWGSTLVQFKEAVNRLTKNHIMKASLKWIEIWEECLDFTPQQILDRNDFIKKEGLEAGHAIFKLFQGLIKE